MEPAGFCPYCDYQMDAGVCPECGAHVPSIALQQHPRGWRRAARKGVRRGILIVLAGLATFSIWMAYWLGLINPGIPFGYWGEFNRARALLQSIPNVEIVRERLNPDLTLEDFTFDIRIDGSIDASLYYHSGRPDWELFTSADAFALSENDEIRCVPLGPGGPLDQVTGKAIRSGQDVLGHLSEIRAWILSMPPDSSIGTSSSTCPQERQFFLQIAPIQAQS